MLHAFQPGERVIVLWGPFRRLDGIVRRLFSGTDRVCIAMIDGDQVVLPAAALASAETPKSAESVLALLYAPDRLEAILGDLEENYRRYAAKHGVAAARRWYWFKVAQEVGFSVLRLLRFAVSIHELLRKLGL
jgi:hypothetical protein